MKPDNRERENRSGLVELATASADTLGLPLGEIIEPMGFWHKAGISDE